MASNGGRDIDQLFKDIDFDVLQEANRAMHKEFRAHPLTSTCECATVEALAVLYEHGYRLVRE